MLICCSSRFWGSVNWLHRSACGTTTCTGQWEGEQSGRGWGAKPLLLASSYGCTPNPCRSGGKCPEIETTDAR